MPQIIATVFQIISFLVAHKDDIKLLIKNIEELIPDAPGNDKAAAVRSFIGTAMGAEAQVEAAWPVVAPLFNAFVALTKKAV